MIEDNICNRCECEVLHEGLRDICANCQQEIIDEVNANNFEAECLSEDISNEY